MRKSIKCFVGVCHDFQYNDVRHLIKAAQGCVSLKTSMIENLVPKVLTLKGGGDYDLCRIVYDLFVACAAVRSLAWMHNFMFCLDFVYDRCISFF